MILPPLIRIFVHPGSRILATREINSLVVNESLALGGGVLASTAAGNRERQNQFRVRSTHGCEGRRLSKKSLA
jgi:hypothetical protein